ncbi:Ig-like domain-containing protein, partial [Mycobacterium sp. pV006]|uniref:Ig-like domain-containing protein n=1 Tax=Mycobacterium sp. pV006 TaxID=3238983 RepID=UPI00351B90B4
MSAGVQGSGRGGARHRKTRRNAATQAVYPTFRIDPAAKMTFATSGSYVGRVGALAVALGVGAVMTTGPGLGVARADTGSESSDKTSSDKTSNANTTRETPRDTTPSTDDSNDPAAIPSISDSPTTDTSDPDATEISIDEDALDDDENALPEDVEDDTIGDVTEDVAETGSEIEPTEEVSPEDTTAVPEEPTGSNAPVVPGGGPTDESLELTTSIDDAAERSARPEPDTTASGPDIESEASEETTSSEPLVFSTQVDQEQSTDTHTFHHVPVDPLTTLFIEIPRAIVDAVTVFVGKLLTPFLAPGPIDPAQPPLLWVVLGWIRNEINRTFFNRSPVIKRQEVTLVPGSGEANDPIAFDAHDSDGDKITYLVPGRGQAGGPLHGTVTVDQKTGTFTYTPDEGFTGTDQFTVEVTDKHGRPHFHGLLSKIGWHHHYNSRATVTVSVGTSATAGPVAKPDTFTTPEDSPLSGNVLTNDSGRDGASLSATLETGPKHGSVVIEADGSFTYTPGLNFNGVDSFTYTADDGSATSSPAIVTISVTPVNDAPVGVDDTYTVDEDGTLTITVRDGVLANDSDVEGSPLTAVLVDGPSNGVVVLNPDGSFVYRPHENFNGTDTFTYIASDGELSSAPVIATISVTAINDAPVGEAVTVVTDEDQPVSGNVIDRITDVDGDPVTVIADHISDAFGDFVIGEDGNFTFTPAADVSGQAAYTYTFADGQGGLGTAQISVTINPVNDAPIAEDSTVAVDEDGVASGTINVRDADGDPVTIVVSSGPTNGELVLNPDRTFTYTPGLNFNGEDSFEYTVSDGVSSFTGTVTISIAAVNDPVVAIDDTNTGTEDQGAVSGNVLTNDRDHNVDGTDEVLTVTPVVGGTTANGGSYTIDEAGNYTYVAAPDFNGEDSFTYTVSDGESSSTGTVTISIAAVNDPVVAIDDTNTGTEDGAPVTGNVLTNDRDQNVDGTDETLTAIPVASGTTATGGTYSVDAEGNYIYTPGLNFNGEDSFTYEVSDGATTATGTVTITIAAVNDPVVAIDDTNTGTEDQGPVTGNVLDNDRDQNVDGTDEVLTVTPVASGTTTNGGSYTIDEAGNYTYAPGLNFNGEDTFTYEVSDGTTTATGTVTISIAAVNDPVVAIDDTNTGTEDGAPVTGNVLDNDRDQNVDGQDETLTVTPVAGGTTTNGGSYTIDEAGNYSYVAAPDFNGEDSFTYTVSDGVSSSTGTVTISIAAANDPVVAIDDTNTGTEDSAPVTGNVLDNDRDQNVDGTDETLTVTPVASGTTTNGGSYTIDEAGNYTYVAAPDFNGTDSFEYTVSDGATTATGTVTISIAAVNDPVVAIDDINTGTEDGAPVTGNVLTNDRDQNVDGTDETLTVTQISGTTTNGGTYTIDAEGNYTYTPATNFNGDDTFTYTVSDGASFSTGTVTISIAAIDDPITAVDDIAVGVEDAGAVTGNVLTNDRDQNVDGPDEILVVSPVSGVTANGGSYSIDAHGNYTYTPGLNFNGEDSFTYTVSDGVSSSTGTVTISIAAVNDPVVAIDDTNTGTEDDAPVTGNVLDNDRDQNVDGQDETLTVTPVAGGTTANGGTYSLDAEGNYTYTPGLNFNGTDSFEYTVSDGTTTATGTVTISIAAVNDPVVAIDDTNTGTEDGAPVTGNVLTNDRDQNVDGTDETLTVTPVVSGTTTNGGTYSLDAEGNYTYTPGLNFNGIDSFEYTVSDGVSSSTGTVTISIAAVNDPVVAIDDTNTGTEDDAPV